MTSRAIEREFGRDSVSYVPAITEIRRYLREGGGKRIRPALLLLAAKLLRLSRPRQRPAGRRGRDDPYRHAGARRHHRRGRTPGADGPPPIRSWGNSNCVLAGDWLYMQAFKIAREERNFRVLDLLIGLTQQMVEGELLQMEKLGSLVSAGEHFDLIYRKTACLFSVSMRLGAILGGAQSRSKNSSANMAAISAWPFRSSMMCWTLPLGETFWASPSPAICARAKSTMAVIHALERCTPEEREKIATILRNRAFNGVTHADILAILNRYGALEAAHARAAQYAEAARKAICTFPDSEIKRALLWAPEFVVAREK